MFSKGTSLTELNLSCNDSHSYNMILLFVNFTDNNIGDEGAKAIGEALKTNTTLTQIYIDSDNNIYYNRFIIVVNFS